MDDLNPKVAPEQASRWCKAMTWFSGAASRFKKFFGKAPPPPKNFTLPVVRRVRGGLIVQNLVSVQPMSAPSGGVFFMDLPPRCEVKGHSGFGGLVSDCTDPECVARHVHES